MIYAREPGIISAAEESTAWPGVSRPTWLGGLGFGFKWNMGWMHDTLSYFQKDPVYRRFHHHTLTFSLMYAFSENFILPLSHDEVVHGKKSLLDKMPGDRWQKFANLRSLYAYMWAHPGKKLLFMGGELAEWKEWNYDGSLHWDLLENAEHQGVQSLIRDLNKAYRANPALYEIDDSTRRLPLARGERRREQRARFRPPRRERRAACRLRPEPLAGAAIRLSRRHARLLPLARAREYGLGVLRRIRRREHGRRRGRAGPVA